MLINPDFDTIRYHLAKFTTIEKIFTFSGKMFYGRGIKQSKPIPTSSLIFIVKRSAPSLTAQTEVVHYRDPDDDIEKCLENIQLGKKISKKKLQQHNLLVSVANWNFIKQGKEFLDFYNFYKSNTDDLSMYYNHILANRKFKSKFYFDIGYNIDERKLSLEKKDYCFPILNNKYWTIKNSKGYWPNTRDVKDENAIKLLKANQEYNLLDSKYKIIWSYNNTINFFFTDQPVIWARNTILGIGSDNKMELNYLFCILNSKITKGLLQKVIKIEQEETRTILVSLQIVKDQIRIPRITEDNQFIKDEIIKHAGGIIGLEDIVLSDLVDFSQVMVQKFDDVKIEGENFVLIKGDDKIKCQIKKDAALVKKVIVAKFADAKLLKGEKINLSDLKSLPVIDFDKQKQLKDYIDDLVFALYFSVSIKAVGLEKAKIIKEACEKNKFYSVVKIQ